MTENTGEHITPESYAFLKNPEQREVMKKRIVDLAHAAKNKQTLVFLDRTARPLAHLLNLVYPIVHPDTEIPKFKFLNIGSEKLDTAPFNDLDGLKQSFGAHNTDNLLKILQSNAPEERLIVDEVKNTGATETFTKSVLEVADNQNKYSFFMFLESQNDKKPFSNIVRTSQGLTLGLPALPWGGIAVLDEDEVNKTANKSFTLTGTYSGHGNDAIKKLHNDFKLLANEIRKEGVKQVTG